MFTNNAISKKENQWKVVLVLGIIICISLLCIIPSVNAQADYTGDLIYQNLVSTTDTVSTSSSGKTPDIHYWGINFDKLTSPSAFVWQGHTGYTTNSPSSGIFTMYYGANVIGTGNYEIDVGSFSGLGADSAQLALIFTHFDKGSYTGTQNIRVTYYPDASLSFTSGSNVGYPAPTNSPLWFNANLEPGAYNYPTKGYYILNDYQNAKNSYILTSNLSQNLINVQFFKDNTSTINTVFSQTGTILWSDSGFSYNLVDKSLYIQYQPIILQMNWGGHIVNSSLFYVPINSYQVSYTPVTPTPNQTITNTLSSLTDSSLSKLQTIIISSKYNDGGDLVHKYFIPTNGYSNQTIEYQKQDNGTWQHWVDDVGFEGNDGLTAPYTFSYTLPVSGSWNITTTLMDTSGNEYNIYTPITVSGDVGTLIYGIYPVDTITGNFLTGQYVSLKNMQTGKWTNVTSNTVTACNFLVSKGQYTWVVTGTGAYSGQIYSGGDLIDSNYAQNVPMQRNDLISATNGTVIFYVVDSNLQPIEGVLVSLPLQGLTGYTSVSGLVTFYPPFNTTEPYSISKSGYQGLSGSVAVTPATNPVYLNKMMSALSVVTVAPTTIAVTPTPNMGIGNGSAGTSGIYGNGTCILNPPETASFIDKLKNMAACNGVKSESSQNIIIGCGIILFFAAIGARAAKGIGAVVTACIAYVGCLALGLMPLWTIITFFIIAGVLFAIKMWRSGDD